MHIGIMHIFSGTNLTCDNKESVKYSELNEYFRSWFINDTRYSLTLLNIYNQIIYRLTSKLVLKIFDQIEIEYSVIFFNFPNKTISDPYVIQY